MFSFILGFFSFKGSVCVELFCILFISCKHQNVWCLFYYCNLRMKILHRIYCHNILGHLTIKENSSVRNGLMSELPAECSSCSEAEHKTATKVLNKCNGMGSLSEQQAAWCQGNSLCCSLFRLPFPQWSFLKE